MLYIDIAYINIISVYLRNFKCGKTGIYNFSCPMCGDSQKQLKKARGYFYEYNSTIYFKCHNCSSGMHFSQFLKRMYPEVYKKYTYECYRQKDSIVSQVKVSPSPPPPQRTTMLASSVLYPLSELPRNHHAIKYARTRQIPPSAYKRLSYTTDYAQLVHQLFPNRYSYLRREERLILPFYNRSNQLVGLQGRSFENNPKQRYLTATRGDDSPLVFGAECVDVGHPIYVVEGPIDSLFISNSVAVASSDLLSIFSRLESIKVAIFVYDNEPRNQEIIKLMQKTIKAGYPICIWPSTFVEKDINALVLSEKIYNIQEFIDRHTYTQLTAQLKFNEWRKI